MKGKYKRKRSHRFSKLKAILPASNIKPSTPKQAYLPTLGEPRLRKIFRGVRSLGDSAWRTFRGFVAGVSVLAGVLFFLTRLDVAPGPTHENSGDLTRVPLSLTNNGFLPIFPDVVTCWVLDYTVRNPSPLRDVRSGGLTNIGFRYTKATATLVDSTQGQLDRGETADFIPVPPIQFKGLFAQSAVFLFIIEYHQKWWPMTLHKRVKYNVSKDVEGKWVWIRPYMSKADKTLNPNTTIIFDAKARRRILKQESKQSYDR